MKLKRLNFLLLLFVFTSFSLSAEGVKFGHINSDLLISIMPDTKKAEKEMENVSKTYENEFKVMMKEYQDKASRYQGEAQTKSDAINQSRMKEMQDMEARIQQYQQNIQKELQKKKFDLMEPIIKKAQEAIDKIAKAKSLTYVFDVAKGSIIYVDDKNSIDIIDDVKKALNITTTK